MALVVLLIFLTTIMIIVLVVVVVPSEAVTLLPPNFSFLVEIPPSQPAWLAACEAAAPMKCLETIDYVAQERQARGARLLLRAVMPTFFQAAAVPSLLLKSGVHCHSPCATDFEAAAREQRQSHQ